jgi:hypothetical protein
MSFVVAIVSLWPPNTELWVTEIVLCRIEIWEIYFDIRHDDFVKNTGTLAQGQKSGVKKRWLRLLLMNLLRYLIYGVFLLHAACQAVEPAS